MGKMKKSIKNRPSELAVSAPSDSKAEYDMDFFKWTEKQASLLKKQEFSRLDIANLIEEIESLGRMEKRTLQSYLELLLMHMLKVEFQPEKHTKSWDLSIRNSRQKFKQVLAENPSLKPKLKEILEYAYKSARLDAAQETELEENIFPEKCPWSIQKILFEETSSST